MAAKQGLIRNAANTICHVKHMLGLTYDDPQVEVAKKQAVQVKVVLVYQLCIL